jgi:hypothetical protein
MNRNLMSQSLLGALPATRPERGCYTTTIMAASTEVTSTIILWRIMGWKL